MIKKSEMLELILFGFGKYRHTNEELIESYKQKYLRIPPNYLKNNVSVVEKLLDETSAKFKKKQTPS